MKKRRIAALLFVAAMFVACGTDEGDPTTPEPVATADDDAGGGGMMDDQDLDY